jgi:hypothetical protein
VEGGGSDAGHREDSKSHPVKRGLYRATKLGLISPKIGYVLGHSLSRVEMALHF